MGYQGMELYKNFDILFFCFNRIIYYLESLMEIVFY